MNNSELIRNFIILLLLNSFGSLTLASTPALPPRPDKRLEVFEFLTSQINEWNAKQLQIEATTYSDMLKRLDELHVASSSNVKTPSARSLQRIREQIERFIKATEKVKTNSQNCQLQAEASRELDELPKQLQLLEENQNNSRFFNAIRQRYNEATTKIHNEFPSFLNGIYQQLPTVIERFRRELNQPEREEYKDFLKSCSEFLIAPNPKKKNESFGKLIYTLIHSRTMQLRSADKADCKWNWSKIEDFSQKVSSQ
ncbi:uncharacterized protein [Musca autumnalis]|uniref:uncharacterized protein n=1 Tax=Musca autumnalis TaxID=221902 RepID=UPI003CE87460